MSNPDTDAAREEIARTAYEAWLSVGEGKPGWVSWEDFPLVSPEDYEACVAIADAILARLTAAEAARDEAQRKWAEANALLTSILAQPNEDRAQRDAALARAERLREQRNTLAAFARDLLSDLDDLDAEDVTNMAIRHGLMAELPFDPQEHDDPTGHAEPGQPWLELTDLVAPIAALSPATEEA